MLLMVKYINYINQSYARPFVVHIEEAATIFFKLLLFKKKILFLS